MRMTQKIHRGFFARLPRALTMALAGLGMLSLSGCAAPVIGALTIGEVLTIAGISSTLMTGRDLGEHALSALTGKDCRFLEAALREGRSFCEEKGSPATENDFAGLPALFGGDGKAEAETQVAASIDPQLLGFAPVNRHAAHEFSLEIAREAAREKKSLHFGMVSASFGQSWAYDLDIEPDTSDAARLAQAEPAPARVPVTSLGLRPAHSPYMGL